MTDDFPLVRIADLPEASEYAGRLGRLIGRSIPSSSEVGPVIGVAFGGSARVDLAYAVLFEGDKNEQWFAPHLVDGVERPR